MGESADLLFCELRGDEWGDSVVLGCGLLAGAKFAVVVEVSAIGEVGEASFCAGFFHLGEEFVFAVEAAAGVVALIVGVVELVGVEDLEWDVAFGGEGEGGG